MIEPLDGMPPGTVGFRMTGEVTREDYRSVLEPALRNAVESGEVRGLYLIDSGFEMDGGAVLEDAKVGLTLGLPHLSAWKRSAVVTDVDWVRRAVRLLGWMAPGEVRVWGLDGLNEAREWVAG